MAQLSKISVVEGRHDEKFYVKDVLFFFQTEQVKYSVWLEGNR